MPTIDTGFAIACAGSGADELAAAKDRLRDSQVPEANWTLYRPTVSSATLWSKDDSDMPFANPDAFLLVGHRTGG